MMNLHNVPVPPGQVVGLVIVVILDRVRAARLPGPRVLHVAAGTILLAAGCSLTVWAMTGRRRNEGGRFELEHPLSLATTGSYALTRHPMYLGWWMIHLGFGMLRSSAWVLATVPLAVMSEHRGVLAEERELSQTFGSEYEEYAGRTPRYVRWRALGHPLAHRRRARDMAQKRMSSLTRA